MNKEILKLKEKLLFDKNKLEKNSKFYSSIRLLIFLILIISVSIYLSKHKELFLILSNLLIFSFIVIIIIHSNINKKIDKIKYYLYLIKKYENRCSDEWKKEIIPVIESDKNFANDLNILNNNSLLKYLDFTQSLGSKNNLIASLSLDNIKLTKEDIKKRQESITEISKNYEYLLDFQYILSKIKNINKIDYKEYSYFFDNIKENKKVEITISMVLSLLTILSCILSITKVLPSYFFIVLFFLQIICSYIYMIIYNKEFDDISKCFRNFSELKHIYDFIDRQKFKTKLNCELQEKIQNGKSILMDINKISNLNSYRLNFISYLFLNVFFSLNFIILYKYNKLLYQKNSTFKDSILALEELEKMISLATIGIVKENTCLPIIEDDYILEFESIQHILLNEKNCVCNSFISNKDINIITGSNMSGKTSFMKAIGTNLILAYNGTYVNAFSFRCPIAKVFTSINIKDDISHGISTFYGELKRIRDILDYSEKSNGKMIIFIDEIFKGTNYNDRILGAKEVLKQLVELNCIVFLTTHDLELCVIKNKAIKNYHFSEKYIHDKISFDYKIKKGKCNTTNAKYLMNQMGIIKNYKSKH